MQKPRFLALDVFRGLSVCVMIIVNTSGPGAPAYPWLVHAKWFGFTLADLVFPSFLFAVGAGMSFAMGRGLSNRAFLLKVVRRSALIFLLGYLMYWYPFVRLDPHDGWRLIPIGDTRIMGVLQRIALTYALAAIAARYLTIPRLLALCVIILLGYWAMLIGFGTPGQPLSKLGNLGTRLDLLLLGKSHLYRKDGGFDPEGLLGTLPATVNVLAGYIAARVAAAEGERGRVVRGLLMAGAALAAAGLAWSVAFPIAKKLWTSSYVLLTCGLDLVLLAALIWLLEIRRVPFGIRFFQVFGKNPLVIYLFSELFVTTLGLIKTGQGVGVYDWIGVHLFQAMAPGPFGALLCAVAYMLVCWSLGYLMDRRGIVVKL
jgi:predicted acyltransferase